MRFLGNLLWFICGGFLSGLSWTLSGIIWCISFVGLPYGLQCFKFASLAFAPFGKEVVYGGGVPSLDYFLRYSNGSRKLSTWLRLLCNFNWDTTWITILQNC